MYNGNSKCHDAPVKTESSYEDPSFGKKVAMMKAGLTDTLLVCAARHGRMYQGMYGRISTMELLIEMHADVNQQSGYGETPLFAACLESHARAVRILVEAGARLDFVHDMTGLNILVAAVRDFHEEDRDRLHEWAYKRDPWGDKGINHYHDVVRLVEEGYDPPRGTVWQEGCGKLILTQFQYMTVEAKAQAQLAVVTYLLGPCQIDPFTTQKCLDGTEMCLDGIDWLDFCLDGMEHNALFQTLMDGNYLATPGAGLPARRDIVLELCKHGFDPNIQIPCPADLCSWTPQPPDCSLLHVACLQARHCRDSRSVPFRQQILHGEAAPSREG